MAGIAIRKSSHIGCLAAYLRPYAERGQMIIVACSDPSVASVAPFGGTKRIYTPNPLGAGWPSPGGPVMIDVSMSITTNGMTGRLRGEGKQFEHPWLLDAEGHATRDPNAFFTDPPGSIMPLGGAEYGHKGFALGLLLEALTSALAGHGRADEPTEWGASVFVLVIDPQRFGGSEAFLRETGWMADAVHSNPPGPSGNPVRLPGERGLALRAEALAHGVILHPSLPPMLAARAASAGIAAPSPITGA
jgi:L-lactate dehydrogenase